MVRLVRKNQEEEKNSARSSSNTDWFIWIGREEKNAGAGFDLVRLSSDLDGMKNPKNYSKILQLLIFLAYDNSQKLRNGVTLAIGRLKMNVGAFVELCEFY